MQLAEKGRQHFNPKTGMKRNRIHKLARARGEKKKKNLQIVEHVRIIFARLGKATSPPAAR